MTKQYIDKLGCPMDANWHSHSQDCPTCREVEDSPGELGKLCLDGAILYKRAHTPKPVPRSEQRAQRLKRSFAR